MWMMKVSCLAVTNILQLSLSLDFWMKKENFFSLQVGEIASDTREQSTENGPRISYFFPR